MSGSRFRQLGSSLLLLRRSTCLENYSLASFNGYSTSSDDSPPKKFKDIPGPRTVPLLKSAWNFLPYIGRYNFDKMETSYAKLYSDYGPLVRIEVQDQPNIVFVLDRDLISQVYRNESFRPHRPGFDSLRKYRESRPELYPHKGLLVSQGDEWHSIRMTGQPQLLKPGASKVYIDAMQTVSDDFVTLIRNIRDNRMEVQNLFHLLMRWALESIASFTLNRRLGCLDKSLRKDSTSQLLIDAVEDTFHAVYKLEFNFGWERMFPKKTFEKFTISQNFFTAITLKLLTDALEEVSKQESKEERPKFLVGLYIHDKKMSLDQILGVLYDLFFAGIDTTSATVAFLLAYLAVHKNKQNKLYEEIVAAFPSKDAPITKENYVDIPYLNACIKEVARLHPATVGTGRILDRDFVLGGYTIPKGTIFALITSFTSRREEYFVNPREFIPERWLHSRSEKHKILRQEAGLPVDYQSHGFASTPFSFGIRGCIGREVAQQEIEILLIKILQNFTLDCLHPLPETRQGVVNVPDRPVNVIFRDRM